MHQKVIIELEDMSSVREDDVYFYIRNTQYNKKWYEVQPVSYVEHLESSNKLRA